MSSGYPGALGLRDLVIDATGEIDDDDDDATHATIRRMYTATAAVYDASGSGMWRWNVYAANGTLSVGVDAAWRDYGGRS